MIDQTKLKKVKTAVNGEDSTKEPLAALSSKDLMKLRSDIDVLMPGTVTKRSLSDMDMTTELMTQFEVIKKLQENIIDNPDVPANQKAQVANAVASTLQALIRMQSEFYTSERFRGIENLVIKTLKLLPLDVAEDFLEKYEAMGTRDGQ